MNSADIVVKYLSVSIPYLPLENRGEKKNRKALKIGLWPCLILKSCLVPFSIVISLVSYCFVDTNRPPLPALPRMRQWNMPDDI